nr:vanadium-dependent haloperoxidase [Geodermatophilaceae bacterium]
TPYVASTRPGNWRPAAGATAATPNWGKTDPFTLNGDSPEGWRATFRPPIPAGASSTADLLRSAAYTAQFDEVKSLGRFDSAARTPDQTDIARFWANDLDGTSKPPGQLFGITKTVAVDHGLDVPATARLFALVAAAMADAAIVAWDAKYDTELDLWRPDTAIQLAALDGNKDTAADPLWQPLSQEYGGRRFSPPFPAFVSGHATFAAAHAGVMRAVFGDATTFEATTEDPFYTGLPRNYATFSAAAEENALSRIYLGVHYRWDADFGMAAGYEVADRVMATLLL